MIKENLFECKVGDGVLYTEAYLFGTIKKLNKKSISIVWDDDESSEQTISHFMYLDTPAWHKVIGYDDEKDLLFLKLKYTPL